MSKITISCLVNIGQYENIKVEVEGETKEEVIDQIKDTLNDFGSGDPEIKHRINSYITRVLEKHETNPNSEIESGQTDGLLTKSGQSKPESDILSEQTSPESNSESGQKTCAICGNKITENEIQFSKMVFSNHAPMCKTCVNSEARSF